MQSQLIL